jgi:hypothetical protein
MCPCSCRSCLGPGNCEDLFWYSDGSDRLWPLLPQNTAGKFLFLGKGPANLHCACLVCLCTPTATRSLFRKYFLWRTTL